MLAGLVLLRFTFAEALRSVIVAALKLHQHHCSALSDHHHPELHQNHGFDWVIRSVIITALKSTRTMALIGFYVQ